MREYLGSTFSAHFKYTIQSYQLRSPCYMVDPKMVLIACRFQLSDCGLSLEFLNFQKATRCCFWTLYRMWNG